MSPAMRWNSPVFRVYTRPRMKRLAFILALAPLAILMPLLCQAGVDVHGCACGDNVCCEESGETGCDADPCATTVAGRAECVATPPSTTPCEYASSVCMRPFASPPYAPPESSPPGRLLPTAAIIHPILI